MYVNFRLTINLKLPVSNEYENIYFRSLIPRKDGTEPLARTRQSSVSACTDDTAACTLRNPSNYNTWQAESNTYKTCSDAKVYKKREN